MQPLAHEGDLLFYYRVKNPYEEAVDVGEYFELGHQSRYYYHVAIALSSAEKVEADGHFVAKHRLIYNGAFDIFRPPAPYRERGINAILAEVGERYDWWLDIDDGLRYLTRDRIHLPVEFIRNRERKEKQCVTLALRYLALAGYQAPFRLGRNSSPQDVYRAVKKWKVAP